MGYCKIEEGMGFKKGNQLAKGKGRPKGQSPLSAIRQYLDKSVLINDPFTKEKVEQTIASALGTRWLRKAFDGDNEATKDILDRIDGKPNQPTTHEGGIEIKVHILKDDNARPKR